ncbi:MAG: hypothetical protein ACRDDY_10695 [Clostridium sp.]|uniref:hypothetical protein n=1 Tax=Clostridium sp. TaxID=1506 RepID=UPI003EE67F70
MEIVKCWFVGYNFYSRLENKGKKTLVTLDDSTGKFKEFVFTGGKNYEKKILDYIILPEETNSKLLKTYNEGISLIIAREDKKQEGHNFRKDWWL